MYIYAKATKLSDVMFFCFSNIAVSPGQYLISRRLYEEVGGYTNLKSRGSDDWGIFIKLLCLGVKIRIFFSPNSIFYYRLHPLQGMKTLNIRASVKEQIDNIVNNSSNMPIYLRLLICFKVSLLTSYMSKILYLFFYNRTNRKQ